MAVTKAQKEQLCNFANYGFYKELVEEGCMEVDAHIFTRRNIDDYPSYIYRWRICGSHNYRIYVLLDVLYFSFRSRTGYRL